MKEEDEDDGGDPRFRGSSAAGAAAEQRFADEHFPEQMQQTPLAKLYDAMRGLAGSKKDEKPNKEGVVVYWMRCDCGTGRLGVYSG